MSNVAVECLREFPWDERINPPSTLIVMSADQARLFEAEGFVRITNDNPTTVLPFFAQRPERRHYEEVAS